MIRLKRKIQKSLRIGRVVRSQLMITSNHVREEKNHKSINLHIKQISPSKSSSCFPLSNSVAFNIPLQWLPIDQQNQSPDRLLDQIGQQLSGQEQQIVNRIELQSKVDSTDKSSLQIVVDSQKFVQQVLQVYGNEFHSLTNEISSIEKKENVIVEFSSPNIAKPFHCGHFRSTIMGNFVSNLMTFVGHRVQKINYLGDWGTQFGLLAVGFERWGDEQRLQQDACQHLLEVYVKVNRVAEMEEPEVRRLAKEKFVQLEQGTDVQLNERWKQFRSLSLKQYEQQYERLGIQFDTIEFESMYSSSERIRNCFKIDQQPTTNQLEVNKFVRLDDGALVFRKRTTGGNHVDVPLLKQDGSSLYLSRDTLAAIDRKQKFNFDRMFYVVDNAQRPHFDNLKAILNQLEYDWNSQLQHIPYGRINGMSTRKGNVVLLEEILNEAKQQAIESTRQTKTSKVSESELNQVCDVLGISCLIVNDFKRRRVSNYEFNWQQTMDQRGDSGISLQYAHSRLCNLKVNAGIDLNCDQLNWNAINRQEALALAVLISQFDEVIELCYQHLEPFYLVKYLFQLSKGINKAYKVFQVKDQPDSIAQTRLLLFHCAHNVFRKGMQILGIKPLDRI